MTHAELLAALAEVTSLLGRLGVRHFVGGSLASSAHGVPRASLDADLVAELGQQHVAGLVAGLGEAFACDEGRIRDAIVRRRSFNLIHIATMYKIDMFVSKGRPFDSQAFERARRLPLDEAPGATGHWVASAEDIVLAKLEWFRDGGAVSERQWGDVIGVLRTATAIDREYLQRWASALGVADLMQRALAEAAA